MAKWVLHVKWLNKLRVHLGFSAREMNGVVVLLPLLCLLLFFIPALKRVWPHDNLVLTALGKDKLEPLLISLDATAERKAQFYKGKYRNDHQINLGGNIDPNKLSATDWEKIGLRSFLAKRITNYVQKGGRFRVKTDLLKIYGFPEEVFELISPALLLPDTLQHKKFAQNNYSSKDSVQQKNRYTDSYKKKRTTNTIEVFDLNIADTAQLNRIKGIGAVLAQRIVTHRQKLGGFYAYEQLKEIYGLKPEVIEEIIQKTRLTTNSIVKININKATYAEMRKHPYIGKHASVIEKYRKHNDAFQKPTDLLKIVVIDETTLQKLSPYLSF